MEAEFLVRKHVILQRLEVTTSQETQPQTNGVSLFPSNELSLPSSNGVSQALSNGASLLLSNEVSQSSTGVSAPVNGVSSPPNVVSLPRSRKQTLLLPTASLLMLHDPPTVSVSQWLSYHIASIPHMTHILHTSPHLLPLLPLQVLALRPGTKLSLCVDTARSGQRYIFQN